MKKMISIAVFAIFVQSLFAQEAKDIQDTKSNIVKLNLFSLPLKNVSVQYERILNKTIGLNLGIRFMPSSKIPGINYLTNKVKKAAFMQNAKTSNLAITPEAKFYVGKKGYGNGFYIGSYYRFASFGFANFNLNDEKYEFTRRAAIGKGFISSHSLGMVLGVQWILGKKKNIILDWTIFGAHYGMSKVNLDAVFNVRLTDEEQAMLKKEIDDKNIPLIKNTTTVNANGIRVKISEPWIGLRSAFSIGIGFK